MAGCVHPESAGDGAPPVCLWLENPYRLVTWWDVERFAGADLHYCISELNNILAVCSAAQPKGDATDAELLRQPRTLDILEKLHLIIKSLPSLESILKKSGLPTAAETLRDFRSDLTEAETMSAADVVARVEEVQRTIRREMRTVLFFYMSPENAQWYREPLKDWEAVVGRWPKMAYNISESSLCFALGRYAASIFHTLLVAEFGVIQIGELLGVSGDKPGWGCISRLEGILGRPYKERARLEKRHSQLLKEIVPMIVALRDSWRHKISHVDNQLVWLDTDLSPQIASEVRLATRGFMRRLASELPIAITSPRRNTRTRRG